MQELKDNITWSNILICHIIGIPVEKDKEWGEEMLEDITVESFPKLMKWRTLNHGSKKLRESQVG